MENIAVLQNTTLRYLQEFSAQIQNISGRVDKLDELSRIRAFNSTRSYSSDKIKWPSWVSRGPATKGDFAQVNAEEINSLCNALGLPTEGNVSVKRALISEYVSIPY